MLENNTTYVNILPKEYKTFKVIKIVDEKNVEVICNFIHPKIDEGNY